MLLKNWTRIVYNEGPFQLGIQWINTKDRNEATEEKAEGNFPHLSEAEIDELWPAAASPAPPGGTNEPIVSWTREFTREVQE